MCIIRVGRDQHNIAWGALTLLTLIEGVKYIPNVVHVSGKNLLTVVLFYLPQLNTMIVRND
jgi:RNase P/RNase MRP subunit POP5